MTAFVVTALILAAAAVLFIRVRAAIASSDAKFAESLRRHGLEAFDAHLKTEIVSGKRATSALSLTRMMIEILDELDRRVPERDQAAVVEPPDDGYRLACEELVKLGRLSRVREGIYTPAHDAS